jgi:hypothetical protein
MKGFLCACLLVLLQPTPAAQAYEEDIHYSATYVLARAVGWPEAESLTIASANQGVDENPETVAALEVDTTPSHSLAGYVTSSLHQAEKNLRFHCFSTARGESGRISADVRKVMAEHFANVPEHDEAPQRNTSIRNTKNLIALGAALHCQQDAHAHVDFGGSCGTYSGSCYGHTYENFLDQLVFGLLKKHYFNPDHPAVSGEDLLEALQGTVDELSARRPKGSARAIPAVVLAALAGELRASGLEVPEEVRRQCNRYIAGKWLHDYIHPRAQDAPFAVETLSAEVAANCRNASLRSATVVRIPDARFPRLKSDASPWLVRADGSYQQIAGGDSQASSLRFGAKVAANHGPDHRAHGIKVQLSHWTQVLALPAVGQVALSSAGKPPGSRPR